MKIGIIHHSFDVIGGAEKTTLNLIDALCQTNHSVTLYTTSKLVQIPDKIRINKILRFHFPSFWRIQRMIENEILFNSARNEDLIIVMSGGLSISDLKNKDILVYCHSTFQEAINFVNSSSKGIMKFYHDLIKRKIAKQISLLKNSNVKLIANSEFTRKKIEENLKKDSIVIFPPVEMDRFIGKHQQKDGVVTIARYSQEKNLDFAINVMKTLPISYKIIGNAKLDTQFSIFNRLSNQVKLNPNIKLLCNVEKQITEQTLLSSKIYFHTSEETLGLSVVESIAAGCIPIVPNNSAHCETVPFSELRYEPNNITSAKELITRATKGDFDDYVSKLQQHIKIFNSDNFKKKIIDMIQKNSVNVDSDQTI